jgi:predicted membrane channel-forming protein YqfA (hemolysin III family)
MEQGWDPKVTGMFKKILNSISFGLIWMIACATAGLYFKLAYVDGKPDAGNIIFYVLMATTLFLLLRYLYKTWKNEMRNN